MSYVEGFLLPVPEANRQAYRDLAEGAWEHFRDAGAHRLVEAWGDDVPRGTTNDLWQAVKAGDAEQVVFSWVTYPDRATRDAANAAMAAMEGSGTDMPFDGKRMIWSGFVPLHEVGTPGGGYVDGSVIAVPEDARDAYRHFCARVSALFVEHGALYVFDGWGEDIRLGEVTDFRRATLAQEGETVSFGWVEWPSKDVRDAAWRKLMGDERMGGDMPFDGKRMMFGGFEVIVDRSKEALA